MVCVMDFTTQQNAARMATLAPTAPSIYQIVLYFFRIRNILSVMASVMIIYNTTECGSNPHSIVLKRPSQKPSPMYRESRKGTEQLG